MRILVCVKQVPDVNEVKMRDDHTLDRSSAAQIMNPADESALEIALRLRDACGGSVSVVSMGQERAEAMLREALSRGADVATLLTDPAFAGADTLITAKCLMQYVRKYGGYDLILCGRRSIDGETGQVGPMLASMLDIPCVVNAVRIDACGNNLMIDQLTENGIISWETDAPALITMCEWSYRLRLPALKGLRRARTIEIPHIHPKDIEIPRDMCGIHASPTSVVRVQTNVINVRNCKKIQAEQLPELLQQMGVL